MTRAEGRLGVRDALGQELGDEPRVARVRDVGDEDAEPVPREVRVVAEDLRVVDAGGQARGACSAGARDEARRRVEDAQASRLSRVRDVVERRIGEAPLVGLDHQLAVRRDRDRVRVSLFVGAEVRPAELSRAARVPDVEDHGAPVPVGHERQRPVAVRDHGVDEGRRHLAEPGARASLRSPRADPDGVARVGDVVDAQAREAPFLGVRDRRVDVRVTAGRLEPELVRAPRLGADKRELAGMRGARDVVEAEAVERAHSGARLVARRGERPVEGGSRHMLDDRLLGPAAGEAGVGRRVAEGGDALRAARVPDVVDADTERRALRAVPAR